MGRVCDRCGQCVVEGPPATVRVETGSAWSVRTIGARLCRDCSAELAAWLRGRPPDGRALGGPLQDTLLARSAP